MRAAILGVCLALATACERPAPKPDPEAPKPSTPTPSDAPPRPKEIVYRGDGPVKTAPARLLFEHGGMQVEAQDWKSAGAEGIAWRVRLPRSAAYRALHAEALTKIDALPAPQRPGALINGGFYEERGDGYGPMGVVIDRGVQLAPYRKRGGSGIFAVVDGAPKIVHRKTWGALQGQKPEVALQSIDRIVDASASLVRAKPQARRAARSAVALTEDHVWLVVAAAHGSVRVRTDGAKLVKTSYLGMTLGEFASYMVDEVRAQEALNLDGAVSTQLQVTAPGHKLHVRGERGVLQGLWVSPSP